jgi:DNA-binding response OmpR family regulator
VTNARLGEENEVYDVLVIEPKEPLVRIMAWALREEGCRVEVAHTAEDGVRLQQERPRDAVVFNTELPLDARRRFVEAFRAASPLTCVLDLQSDESGADAHLAEPFRLDDLLSRVSEFRKARGQAISTSDTA